MCIRDSAEESAAILGFLKRFEGKPSESWITVAHTLLMSNEAQFID